MKKLTRLTSSSLLAYGLIFASNASALDWINGGPKPIGVRSDLEGAIMSITNYVLGFITMIATLIIIYGGILYLTASGNQDTIGRGKQTIVYGLVGLVVAGLAYAMVIAVKSVIS